ncbi:hypothetical protein [Paenibacillus naphthalenovorans]
MLNDKAASAKEFFRLGLLFFEHFPLNQCEQLAGIAVGNTDMKWVWAST